MIKKKKIYDNECFKRVLFIVLSSLLLSGGLIVFSCFHSDNSTYFTIEVGGIFEISIIIAGLFAALLVLILFNKFSLLNFIKPLLCLAFVPLIYIFVTSFIDSFWYKTIQSVHECKSGYIYYSYFWDEESFVCGVVRNNVLHNAIGFPISMTIISSILIAISIILCINIFKIKQPIIFLKNKTIKDKEKIMISPIEQEINNIKSLMDKGVINEEEYNTLRKGIIEKYSKN